MLPVWAAITAAVDAELREPSAVATFLADFLFLGFYDAMWDAAIA